MDPTTDAGVAHVARLSRLALDPDEAEAMKSHMQKILAWVDELSELDTEGMSPSIHDHEGTPTLRPDEVRPSLPVEDALANAPRQDGGGFVVPRVISE